MLSGAGNSSSDFLDPFHQPSYLFWFIVIVLPIVVLVAIIGNTLTIVLTWRTPSLRKRHAVFIISIAASNVAIALLPAIGYVTEVAAGRWLFGKVPCYMVVAVEFSAVTSCNFCLVAVALDRCMSVFRPLTRRSPKTPCRVVAALWLVGVTVAATLVWLDPAYIPRATNQGHYCKETWVFTSVGNSHGFWYPLVFCVMLYALPALLLTVIYAFIARRLWSRTRPGEDVPGKGCGKELRRKKRTVLLLIATVLLFQMCWLPSYAQETLLAVGGQEDWSLTSTQVVNVFANMMGYMFGCLNPWLLPIFNMGYRKAYVSLWNSLRWHVAITLHFPSYGTFASTDTLPGIALEKNKPQFVAFKRRTSRISIR